MYTRPKRIIGNKEDLSNYIEDYDLYNSLLVKYITTNNLDKSIYVITKYEYRPDLIAKDFYGSDSYTGILMIQAGMSLDGYTRGAKLFLLSKNEIDSIIDAM